MKKRITLLLSALTLTLLPSTSVKAETGPMHIFEPCEKSQQLPCISSFNLVDSTGKVFTGKLTGVNNPANENLGNQIFTGTNYEWTVPGITQPSGNTTFTLGGLYFPLNTPYCWMPNQDEKSCDRTVDEISLRVTVSPFGPVKSWNLNPDYKYRITIRLPKSFSSAMLVGEGATGEVVVTQNADQTQELQLMGQPAEVVTATNNDLSLAPHMDTRLGFYLQSKDSAQAVWTNACNQGKLLSYWHNTNIGTTPVWSASDGAIEMQTAAPHLRPDGALNSGLIELQVPVQMAKCLWGVDLSRAVSASISASYQDGQAPEIITTKTVVQSGNYILSSYGFHYSSPLLKVKMQEDLTTNAGAIAMPVIVPIPAATPTTGVAPTPTVQPVVQAQKKITITCIKNKVTKMVTGVKPVCPAGYKKK
jgi:hypothetical protein